MVKIAEAKPYDKIDVSEITEGDRKALREAIILLKGGWKGGLNQAGEIEDILEKVPATVWYQAGIIALKLDWIEETEYFYRKAIAIDPKDVLAWYNLG